MRLAQRIAHFAANIPCNSAQEPPPGSFIYPPPPPTLSLSDSLSLPPSACPPVPHPLSQSGMQCVRQSAAGVAALPGAGLPTYYPSVPPSGMSTPYLSVPSACRASHPPSLPLPHSPSLPLSCSLSLSRSLSVSPSLSPCLSCSPALSRPLTLSGSLFLSLVLGLPDCLTLSVEFQGLLTRALWQPVVQAPIATSHAACTGAGSGSEWAGWGSWWAEHCGGATWGSGSWGSGSWGASSWGGRGAPVHLARGARGGRQEMSAVPCSHSWHCRGCLSSRGDTMQRSRRPHWHYRPGRGSWGRQPQAGRRARGQRRRRCGAHGTPRPWMWMRLTPPSKRAKQQQPSRARGPTTKRPWAAAHQGPRQSSHGSPTHTSAPVSRRARPRFCGRGAFKRQGKGGVRGGRGGGGGVGCLGASPRAWVW